MTVGLAITLGLLAFLVLWTIVSILVYIFTGDQLIGWAIGNGFMISALTVAALATFCPLIVVIVSVWNTPL